MQIKVDFLCRDSILAAPLVLDLALFFDLAQRAGLSGVQEWLSFYFKSPQVAPGLYPEHDLFIQQTKLKNTLRWLMGEEQITHLGVEYYEYAKDDGGPIDEILPSHLGARPTPPIDRGRRRYFGAPAEPTDERPAGAGPSPARSGRSAVTAEPEGGHYTLVTVETDQPGESELDKLAKRFLSTVHAMVDETHVLRGAY